MSLAATFALTVLVMAGATVPPSPPVIGVVQPPVREDGLPAASRATIDSAQGATPARVALPSAISATAYARYIWPLDRHLRDQLMTVNYTDLDPTSGRLDYAGGTWNYDGHRGHDFELTSFRLMDRGTQIRAAASGVVTYLNLGTASDRNCDNVPPDDGDWIWIAYGDGTFHEYYHLRQHSMTVQLGESVQPGELLGLVGSSGNSTGPHLHFESGDYGGPGGTYEFRDPSTGSSNPLPSLWNAQPSYAGAESLWVTAAGMVAESEVGGSIFNFTYCDLMAPLPEPVTYGSGEARLCFWMQFQSRAGDTATIAIRKPDGSTYGSFDYASPGPQQLGWIWAYYPLQPYVTTADWGTWHYVITRKHGPQLVDHPFVLGAATTFGPRFWPRAGRSFRIDGTVQRDTLRNYPLSSPVTYALLNAPAWVTLQDSIVTVGPTSSQTSRSAFFAVVATDGAARRDTAFYHVVDPGKPLDPLAAVAPASAPRALALAAAPQPFAREVRVTFALPAAGAIELDVLDLAGRRIRTVARGVRAAGRTSIVWDGRDEAGRTLPAGLYFARLRTSAGEVTTRLVRI